MTVALGADFGVVDVPLNAIVYPRSSRGGLREGVLGGTVHREHFVNKQPNVQWTGLKGHVRMPFVAFRY